MLRGATVKYLCVLVPNMMRADCDSRRCICLEDDVRSRYGESFVLLETEDGLLLVPAPEDATEAVKVLLDTAEAWG